MCRRHTQLRAPKNTAHMLQLCCLEPLHQLHSCIVCPSLVDKPQSQPVTRSGPKPSLCRRQLQLCALDDPETTGIHQRESALIAGQSVATTRKEPLVKRLNKPTTRVCAPQQPKGSLDKPQPRSAGMQFNPFLVFVCHRRHHSAFNQGDSARVRRPPLVKMQDQVNNMHCLLHCQKRS